MVPVLEYFEFFFYYNIESASFGLWSIIEKKTQFLNEFRLWMDGFETLSIRTWIEKRNVILDKIMRRIFLNKFFFSLILLIRSHFSPASAWLPHSIRLSIHDFLMHVKGKSKKVLNERQSKSFIKFLLFCVSIEHDNLQVYFSLLLLLLLFAKKKSVNKAGG